MLFCPRCLRTPSTTEEPTRECGVFYALRAYTSRGASTVIQAGSGLIQYPSGEYARRSLTVLSSRPFLRSAEGRIRKSTRFPMSATFFLSRPGRCAGRVPLSLLVYKLIRSGEEAAAQALQELPLPFQCRRVWWLLSGNKLILEVA